MTYALPPPRSFLFFICLIINIMSTEAAMVNEMGEGMCGGGKLSGIGV